MDNVLEPDTDAPANQPRIRLIVAGREASLCIEHTDRMTVVYLDDVTLDWLAQRLSRVRALRTPSEGPSNSGAS